MLWNCIKASVRKHHVTYIVLAIFAVQLVVAWKTPTPAICVAGMFLVITLYDLIYHYNIRSWISRYVVVMLYETAAMTQDELWDRISQQCEAPYGVFMSAIKGLLARKKIRVVADVDGEVLYSLHNFANLTQQIERILG